MLKEQMKVFAWRWGGVWETHSGSEDVFDKNAKKNN